MLEKFTSRPAEDILIDLYALKLRERDGEKIEQPLITLLLGSNRMPVQGFLIDMKNEPAEKGVVVKLYDSNDVLFVQLYTVAGIAIHQADRVVPLLVDLSPSDVSAMASVTKLEVKKCLMEASARLTAQFGETSISFADELTQEPSELFFTKFFLSDVTMALLTIGKTEAGKEVIQNDVKSVVIKRDSCLNVIKEGNGLVIHFPFNKSYTTNRERHVLIDAIYQVL